MILETPQQFLSAGSVSKADVSKPNYRMELLNSFTSTVKLPNHTITLKKEYDTLPPQHISLENVLVNKSQYTIESMASDV